jgi:protoheme IX farnesyltransferase
MAPLAHVVSRARAAGTSARAFVALTKPRIVALLLVTTVPVMFVAKGGTPAAGLVVATLGGGALAAAGANALNMVLDADIDRIMQRTRSRPVASGLVSPARATLFALGLEAAALGVLLGAVNPLATWLALGAAAFYVIVYTGLLKRTTAQNIVIGGAAGAVPTLVGWAAVTGRLSWAALAAFAVVFLWTPPHFWALAVRARDDYAAVGVPMLPVVAGAQRTARQVAIYTAATVAASLALWRLAGLGPLYLAVAALLGLAYLWLATGFVRSPTQARASGLFRWSIVYLGLLFAAMLVDVVVRHP